MSCCKFTCQIKLFHRTFCYVLQEKGDIQPLIPSLQRGIEIANKIVGTFRLTWIIPSSLECFII